MIEVPFEPRPGQVWREVDGRRHLYVRIEKIEPANIAIRSVERTQTGWRSVAGAPLGLRPSSALQWRAWRLCIRGNGPEVSSRKRRKDADQMITQRTRMAVGRWRRRCLTVRPSKYFRTAPSRF